MGSSLFSALAQEREKRTIDALRLTQLTSMEILLYKSFQELRAWKVANGIFLVLAGLGALWSGSPFLWAVGGAATLACGGLLAIALALTVSTRCDTTSSAVVTGWVTKGVWLVGLPVLDYVIEAVLVLNRDLNLFSYLDPAWVYGTVVNALIFETSGWSLAALLLGGLGSLLVAYLSLRHSSHLIDTSFESAATLDDRARHSAYNRNFPLGLHKNPFMVREMAWQMRSGAGAWPGYAVFLTLFLAPFLYGLAQQHKSQESASVKVVRHSVAQSVPQPVGSQLSSHHSASSRGDLASSRGVVAERSDVRLHGCLCLSRELGLPVPVRAHIDQGFVPSQGERIVIDSEGKVTKVSERSAGLMVERASSERNDGGAKISRSYFETELDRGLLTGLLLTLCYLFIRGGAFMSGAVTGEKERRAWDQIALTGATPESYLTGKFMGVLYFPLKQLLLASPVLVLFALFGGVSLMEVLIIVPLLVVCFLTAGSLGLLASATQPTSHQAQGTALLAGAGVLLAPLLPQGWLIAGLLAYFFLGRASMDIVERLLAAGSVAVWVALFGATASPISGFMRACGCTGFGSVRVLSESLPASAMLLVGLASMALLGYGAYLLAVRSLEQGGSVRV